LNRILPVNGFDDEISGAPEHRAQEAAHQFVIIRNQYASFGSHDYFMIGSVAVLALLRRQCGR